MTCTRFGASLLHGWGIDGEAACYQCGGTNTEPLTREQLIDIKRRQGAMAQVESVRRNRAKKGPA